MAINDLCACCLRSLRNYPGDTVLCTPCKDLKQAVTTVDQFTLVRTLEIYRPDVRVEKLNSDGR